MIGLRNLCTPAYVYFVISIIALVVIGFQNMGNTTVYCVGSQSCEVSSTLLIFVIKLLYILLWTWILNLMCGAGASGIAWFLLILPILVFFILISILLSYQSYRDTVINMPKVPTISLR